MGGACAAAPPVPSSVVAAATAIVAAALPAARLILPPCARLAHTPGELQANAYDRAPMSALSDALAEAGGVAAPPELTARLRELLAGELARGEAELGRARTGYDDPIAVGLAPGEAGVLAPCPLPAEARADAGAAPERAWLVAAAAIGALVEAAGARGGDTLALQAGRLGEHLVLAFPAGDAELAALAFDEAV